MVAKTRSQTKHERAENDRKKRVYDLLKAVDAAMAFLEREFDLSPFERVDLPDLFLAISVMPLLAKDRENLIEYGQLD